MSHLGHLEGVPQPYLGDLLTMVINHLQVLGWSSKKNVPWNLTKPGEGSSLQSSHLGAGLCIHASHPGFSLGGKHQEVVNRKEPNRRP